MESTRTLRPVQPAAGYQGGKRNLARRICDIIDRTDHNGYAEPFVGMGGIFLRRHMPAKVEVINDISGDVATFFRVLQEHYPYFIDMLRFRVASRSEFERLLGMDPARLTDLQRDSCICSGWRLAARLWAAALASIRDRRRASMYRSSSRCFRTSMSESPQS